MPHTAAPPPALPPLTHIAVADAASGARLGLIRGADSVAALATLYGQLADGWARGAAPAPELVLTFFHDSVAVGVLTLASGSFETRIAGQVLHRAARPEEALAFAKLAGVPVLHGPTWIRLGGSPRH